MHVCVLGCGPAGLVAAHAAAQLGHEVAILSNKIMSPIYGAQYLHQPIPGVEAGEPRLIRYRMQGQPTAYLDKVYGKLWDGHISDDLRDQAHLAWDMRRAYRWLWERYRDSIREQFLPDSPDYVGTLLSVAVVEFDLVVNTMPRPVVCLEPQQHEFRSVDIWALGETPDRPIQLNAEDDVIVYNGDSEPGWYRCSRIFGYTTLEWPGHLPKPPITGIAKAKKPLNHTCDCWVGDIAHLGRMGRWQHGKLVHHAYADMCEQLLLAQERISK